MASITTPVGQIAAVLGGEPIYCLDYNLDAHGHPFDGQCAVTETELVLLNKTAVIARYPLESIDEWNTEQLVGSGSFSMLQDGQTTQLCIFTQDHLNAFADLCKMLEYHKETGMFPEADLEEEVKICPKCGAVIPEGTDICFHCAPKGQYLWRIVKLSMNYRWHLFGAIFATAAIQLLWILYPYLQSVIVDDYITPKNQNVPALLGLLGLYLLIPIVMMGMEILNERASTYLSMKMGEDLRRQLFDKIQIQSMKNAAMRPTGDQIKRISNDTEKVQELVGTHGKQAVVQLLATIVILIVMFTMDWKLTLLVLIPVPFVIVACKFIFAAIHKRYRKVWNAFDFSESTLHDILSGIMAVKTFGTERREVEHYRGYSKTFADTMYKADKFWYIVFPMIGFALMLGEYFYLYFGGQEVLLGTLSLGELIRFAAYIGMIYGPLRMIISLPRYLAEAAVSAGKIYEIIDEKEDVTDSGFAEDRPLSGEVTFSHVDFGYKVYKPVLRDISFSVRPGEMIGLVGPSGVGKSTLINLIMRLYDVRGGSITLDGTDIRNLSQQSLRSQIGVVLQDTYLFDGSVLDNILYAKPDATMEEVIEAAKIANAHSFICKMPDGYNEYIGNRGYKLSGGEKQRIAIARAVLRNPKILILDEATASLDTETEKLIQEALGRLMQGRTTFAIAHRLSTLRNADRLIVLDKGKIAETGTHMELMRLHGVYYHLVMAQRQTSKLSND